MPLLRCVPCLAAVLVLSLACTSQPNDAVPPTEPGPLTGSVEFAASIQALSASDVTRVKLTISAPDMSSLIVELAKSNGTWGGVISNIPAGSNRTFLAEAFDSSNTKQFQGQTSGVTITANQTTAVAITLQEIAPPPPYGNEAPIIDSVVATPTTVQTGGSVSVNATVRDPNTGDTFTYAWTASSGTFSASTAATTSWTAPSSTGIQTLTLTVTDSQGAASSISLVINVISGVATGTAAVNISFNVWPVVTRVSASRNRLDVGQSTAVSATASDGDNDTLSYQWAATCTGTWTSATSSSASFTPSSIPAGACNNCRLTVTVQDGRGGQNTGFINLCVAAATTERFAPLITNAYQSSAATAPGQAVTFDVTALDPQASTLTFFWSTNTGSLAAPQSTASTSRVVWAAPSCAVTGVTTSVTGRVTNAYGLSTSRAFTLSGLPACTTSWSSGSSMVGPRREHTATLLPSNKVLVVGSTNGASIASTTVYDPATNTWSAASPLAVASRTQHTATLLNSGKVLVTGGYGNSYLNSAELYDPATNTWSAAAPMATPRTQHTATLLSSGKVLVTGGQGSEYLNSAEVYDPATNTWSPAAPMATRRVQHTATLLSSGKVLVTGGRGSEYLNSAEVYDPATNTWSPTGSFSGGRTYHTATLLPSGKVLITGGYAGSPLFTAAVYDPATNNWTATPSMDTNRAYHSATLLSSGKVLVTGGFAGQRYDPDSDEHYNIYVNNTAVYDPATNSWSNLAPMSTARSFHSALLLASGRVLISGGFNDSNLASVELYTP